MVLTDTILPVSSTACLGSEINHRKHPEAWNLGLSQAAPWRMMTLRVYLDTLLLTHLPLIHFTPLSALVVFAFGFAPTEAEGTCAPHSDLTSLYH